MKQFCENFDKFCESEKLDFESFFYKLAESFKQRAKDEEHPAVKSLCESNAEMCSHIAFNIYASYK